MVLHAFYIEKQEVQRQSTGVMWMCEIEDDMTLSKML